MKQYTLAELTDSRLLYDKNPPKFMFIIIAVVLTLLTAAIVASIYIQKPYVVKATGMVTSNNKATLTVNMAGTITSFNLKEGQTVKAGDTLMTFDDSQTRVQMEQYASQVDYYNKQTSLYNRCIKEITAGTNTFKKSDPEQSPFYNQIALMYSKMAQYNMSDDYYKSVGYTDDQIKTAQAQNASQKSSIKYQTISDLNTQIASLEVQLETASAQYSAYKNLLDEYIVRATQSGIIHLSTAIKPGMILQAGTAIGTISTNSPSDLTVETYISAQDRSKVSINQPAQIAVSGVLQNDYGILNGKIVAIDTDASVNQDKGAVFYKAEIKPSTTVLKNKNGQAISLQSGMVTQANIQYQDSTWFNWVLEQIGLKAV